MKTYSQNEVPIMANLVPVGDEVDVLSGWRVWENQHQLSPCVGLAGVGTATGRARTAWRWLREPPGSSHASKSQVENYLYRPSQASRKHRVSRKVPRYACAHCLRPAVARRESCCSPCVKLVLGLDKRGPIWSALLTFGWDYSMTHQCAGHANGPKRWASMDAALINGGTASCSLLGEPRPSCSGT